MIGRGKNCKMPSSSTPNSPPQPAPNELVRIDKAGSKVRFKHFDEAVREGRVTLADLKEFQVWLGREDFAYKGRKWKDYFTSGAKVVGEDREVQTLLGPKDPAGGLDLAHIRKELKEGTLKKPGAALAPQASAADLAGIVKTED